MLRGLPAVHRLLAEPGVAAFGAVLGNDTIKHTIDDELRALRSAVARGDEVPEFAAIVGRLQARLAHEAAACLAGLLNATGVLLHTNLGRAPLAGEAIDAIREIAGGYSNLEYDLESGERGSRYERVSSLLRAATGAEDAVVVNNCAAAVLLILDTFAKGHEVIVSRNQAIEIGGGFRLPDVLARSGAHLVDVGTTNKVYLRDFERALGPQSALLLRTHSSNFRIEGFVADVAPAELAALGRRVGVPTVEDLGSGALCDLARFGLPHERTVQEAVADGIDLVAFSGDKLLGGPQAGVIVGRSSLIARLRANPLLRALRVDKGTLAALGATLNLHLEPGRLERIPLYRMLATSVAELRSRAHAIVSALETRGANVRVADRSAEGDADGGSAKGDADGGSAVVEVVDTTGYVGGGTLPLAPLPSAGIAITPASGDPNAFAAILRRMSPPLIARAEGKLVVLDLRTIPPERDIDVVRLLREALDATVILSEARGASAPQTPSVILSEASRPLGGRQAKSKDDS